MLVIENLDYDTWNTTAFQRGSVIVCDLLYSVSVYFLARELFHDNRKQVVAFFSFLFAFPGLIIVDNIHFQYNGFLFAFQVISYYFIAKQCYIKCALSFAILLNLKHIYLYIAPVYFVFLLKVYCFQQGKGLDEMLHFSIGKFLKIGISVVTVFALCFAPFVFHIPQVLSRLFPFKRGLTHAYWAPNVWAFYNALDVSLAKMTRVKERSGFTSGLVDDHRHLILPQISPLMTLILTSVSILIISVKCWSELVAANSKSGSKKIVGCSRNLLAMVYYTTIVAYCSFLFGWHVHEKAILLVLIPFSIIVHTLNSLKTRLGSKHELFLMEFNLAYLLCLVAGTYSLFPLLENYFEIPIKFLLLLAYLQLLVPFLEIPTKWNESTMGALVYMYLLTFIPLFVYTDIYCKFVGSKEFLPLMLTSLLCSVGVLGSFVILLKLFWSYNFDHLLLMMQPKSD